MERRGNKWNGGEINGTEGNKWNGGGINGTEGE